MPFIRYPYLAAFFFWMMCGSGTYGAWMLWPNALPWHFVFWIGWLAGIIHSELLKQAKAKTEADR